MNRLLALSALLLLTACHDDHDVAQDPACQQECSPCSGIGDPKVYVGTMPRAGIFGAPIPHLACFPDQATMTADHVCLQTNPDPAQPPLCFYGCTQGGTCQ